MSETEFCRCGHPRSDHSRWPPIDGAEDWVCWTCECVEWFDPDWLPVEDRRQSPGRTTWP